MVSDLKVPIFVHPFQNRLPKLWLCREIMSFKVMNRIWDKGQLCQSPALPRNKPDLLPAMQTKVWHWLYQDLPAHTKGPGTHTTEGPLQDSLTDLADLFQVNQTHGNGLAGIPCSLQDPAGVQSSETWKFFSIQAEFSQLVKPFRFSTTLLHFEFNYCLTHADSLLITFQFMSDHMTVTKKPREADKSHATPA